MSRILLAEDDNDMRRFLAKALQNAGFDVVAFDNGRSAYERFREEPFTMLLTDIVMPGDLQGPKLGMLVRERFPDLPIVFMSGYPQEAAINGNRLRPDDVQLMKPVQFTDLVATLRSKLPG